MSYWFRDMSNRERRTFWACLAGWTLDAMDTQFYAVAMPTLIALWSLSKAQAGMLGTSALMCSAIGGSLAGVLADRFGRVKVLQFTILWFSTFTFLSGLANSYEQILVYRSLQGLGFGGEWAAGMALMAEVVNPRARGRAVGYVGGGWALGYGTAALLFTVMFSWFPREIAWRLLFFVGILPGFAVYFIRRNVEEPDIYLETKKKLAASAPRPVVLDIFKPPLLRSTAVACLLATGTLGGNYTILNWLPTYLSTVRHLTVLSTGSYLGVNILGSFCGYIVAAHLSDGLGRRKTFALCAVCAALTVGVYMLLPISQFATLLLGFPLGFFQSGIVSGMGASFAELFPTHVRATGKGFSFSFGRGIGSLTPLAVGIIAATMPLNQAIGICALASYGLVLVAVVFLPETRASVLSSRLEEVPAPGTVIEGATTT